MCLIVSRNEQIKPAGKDIVVYKVMIKLSGNVYVTPIYKMIVCNPVKGTIIKAEGNVCRTDNLCGYEGFHKIHGGMLHAYQRLNLATQEIKYFGCKYKPTVWQLTIPKGTDYIEGVDFGIAAREMIVEKIFSDEELSTLPCHYFL